MHPDAPLKTTPFNVIDHLKDLPYEEIRAIADSWQLPYAVAMANIHGDLNTGMVIRTACVFGASRVFIFGRRKYDRRSTVGAHHYIQVDAYPNVPDEHAPFNWENMLQIIRVNGYTPILIEQGGYALNTMDVSLYPAPCLVFGSEDTGIPEEVCKGEVCFTIPQIGVVRSLNVAVAAGIAIQHVSSYWTNAR